MPDAEPNQTQVREPPNLTGGTSNGDRFKPLSGPRIEVEVKDRLFREVKRQIFPREVEGILLQTQTGIPYWQDQLFSTMVDTWPRLETNLGKLKKAAGSMEYEVKAYAAKGETPSDSAIEKANFVEAALFGMSSNIPWGQHDFKETISDLIDSIISGLTVLEVYWESRPNLGMVPKCTRWIPARYYRYPYVMDAPDRLMLNPTGMLGSTQLVDFPPAQFLIGQVCSHANFPVYTAPMRCLTPYWIGARFGLEWFMTYAQLFGLPQRIAYYEPGDDQVYAELVSMMKASASATWGVYPKGTEILLQTATTSGAVLPQERLMEIADRICDIMILGQTLTTDVQDSGSRALGSVHKSVLEEVQESAAHYAAKVITTQLVPAIVQFNFGNTDELPTVLPVINTPIDLLNISNAFNILFNQMKIPVPLQQLYERLEFTPPEADEELYEPPGGTVPSPSSPEQRESMQPALGGGGAPTSTGGGGAGEQADIGTEACNELALSDNELDQLEEIFDEAGHSIGIKGNKGPDDSGLVEARRATLKLPKVPQDLDRGPAEKALAIDTEQYFKENAGSIKALKWRSIIDDRTTPQCRELNGKRWRYPDLTPLGHGTEFPGFPPIKWNCRSSVQPVLKTWPQILSWLKGGFNRKTVRAASGEEAGHGGNPYHDEKGRFTGPGQAASGPGGETKPEEDLKKKPARIGKRISTAEEALSEAKKVTRIQDKLEKSRAEAKTLYASTETLDPKTPEYKQAEQGYLAAIDRNFELRDQIKAAGQKFAVRLELAPEEHSAVNFFAYESMGEKLPAEVAKAKDWLQRMVPARNAPRIKHVEVQVDPSNERGSYSPAKERVQIDQNAKATTIIHEVGHRLEYENAGWMKYDNDFHYCRTQRLGLKDLKEIYPHDGYRDDEQTYEDEWEKRGGTAYSGKVYNDGATEILTTGLERMYADPLSFAIQDPDFFVHVFKVLRE